MPGRARAHSASRDPGGLRNPGHGCRRRYGVDPGNIGTASWWAKQKLNKKVNFANWPYYIDVLKGKHPSLEHFTSQTGIQVTYTEPISNNVPFYAKIRPSLAARQYTGFDVIVMTNNAPKPWATCWRTTGSPRSTRP